MKPDIHPAYNVTTVTCGCGNTFTTRSTSPTGQLTVEVCSACHPFYTGKQKILDTGGRVARFEKRFGKRAAAGAEPADTYPVRRRPLPLLPECGGRRRHVPVRFPRGVLR